MKKILITAAIFALGLNAAHAQEANSGFQGKWWLMGQAGVNTSKVSGADNSQTSYSILPVVGYFVAPTVTVGAGVGYLGTSHTPVDGINVPIKSTGTFIIQPLVRKYWGINDKLFIFGQASVPIQFSSIKPEVGDKYKQTSFGIEIAPGLDYFLSNHWSVEAQFGLLGWTNTKPKDGDAVNSFGIGVNSGFVGGLKLGVKYVF